MFTLSYVNTPVARRSLRASLGFGSRRLIDIYKYNFPFFRDQIVLILDICIRALVLRDDT